MSETIVSDDQYRAGARRLIERFGAAAVASVSGIAPVQRVPHPGAGAFVEAIVWVSNSEVNEDATGLCRAAADRRDC